MIPTLMVPFLLQLREIKSKVDQRLSNVMDLLSTHSVGADLSQSFDWFAVEVLKIFLFWRGEKLSHIK